MTRTVQQLFNLEGRTALVTGGSRGLGLQIAQALGEAGARIMLSSRKAGDLEEAAAELQAAGIDTRWIAADCSREEDIRRLAGSALRLADNHGIHYLIRDRYALDAHSRKILDRFL